MKVNEIKKMVEQVVRVEYVADDGTVFYDKKECEKYEESALFAIQKNLKRLHVAPITQYDLIEEGSDDSSLEIFDVQTEKDLENLKRYLYLVLSNNGVSETEINQYFEKQFSNITIGHEVIIFWYYEDDGFYVYGDGSLNGYFEYVKNKYTELTTPKEKA